MLNRKLSTLFCLLLTVLPLRAANIHWLQADFAPCHIKDDNKQVGYCDLIDKIIVRKLPDYSHSYELSTLSRYANLMKTDMEFCTTDLLYSKARAEYMLYSKPRLYILPNGVIAKQNDSSLASYINSEGDIELNKLLQSEMILGLNEGRVYGGSIDMLLKQLPETSPLVFAGSDKKTIQMLVMDRFDYTLGSPTEISLFAQRLAAKETVVFYPIAEQHKLLPTHVSCRKSALAEQIINKINQRLTVEDDEAMVQAYLSWVPKRQHQYYHKLISAMGK